MSEPETETAEPDAPDETPAEAPDEAVEPSEAPDEADEQDEADEGLGAPDDDPDAEQPSGSVTDEKELAKRDQKLDAENTRHAKRVGEIMDEAAVDLVPCPVCMDGIAGWVYAPEAQALPEEAQLRLRQLLGLSGLEGIKQATFATTCPDCDGQGEVRTGSRVVGYETTTCERCGKLGWVRVGAPATNGHHEDVPVPIVTGPTVYADVAGDPEVDHLRSRGFTVIPPPVFAQTG